MKMLLSQPDVNGGGEDKLELRRSFQPFPLLF
jgi:hypothetical protein